jgi:hypothetical protein
LPHLGAIQLTRLSVADIERMHQALLVPGASRVRLSASTVHRVHATLTSALNQAVRRGRNMLAGRDVSMLVVRCLVVSWAQVGWWPLVEAMTETW